MERKQISNMPRAALSKQYSKQDLSLELSIAPICVRQAYDGFSVKGVPLGAIASGRTSAPISSQGRVIF